MLGPFARGTGLCGLGFSAVYPGRLCPIGQNVSYRNGSTLFPLAHFSGLLTLSQSATRSAGRTPTAHFLHPVGTGRSRKTGLRFWRDRFARKERLCYARLGFYRLLFYWPLAAA